MLMDTFPWRRFKRASSQSMINLFPRERKILPMPYSYSHGSVDPGLVAANARVASGTTIPQTSGKKGLSMKNMIKALTEMKQPQGLKAQGASLHGESRPQLPGPPPFAPLGGVNQSIMNVGGLGDEANERWRKIMGYS